MTAPPLTRLTTNPSGSSIASVDRTLPHRRGRTRVRRWETVMSGCVWEVRLRQRGFLTASAPTRLGSASPQADGHEKTSSSGCVGLDVPTDNRRRFRSVGLPDGRVWRHEMDVRLLGFGSIEVDGRTYEHDIVIDRGAVRKRSKKPSKPYRDKFGHTPLSADEELPWGPVDHRHRGPRLVADHARGGGGGGVSKH